MHIEWFETLVVEEGGGEGRGAESSFSFHFHHPQPPLSFNIKLHPAASRATTQ